MVFHSAVIAYLAPEDRLQFDAMMRELVAAGACHWLSALGQHVAQTLLAPVLAEMDALPIERGWRALAELVIDAGEAHRGLLSTLGGSLEAGARIAVADEPIETFLRRRRAQGELASDLDDPWLAECIRAVCLASLNAPHAKRDQAVERLERTLSRLTA